MWCFQSCLFSFLEEDGRDRWTPPTGYNSNNTPHPWIVPHENQNWSDDHWPEDQQFSNEPRFGCEENEERFQNNPQSRISPWLQNGDRYQNDQRYGEIYPDEQRYSSGYDRDPRFTESLRQVSNTMMEVIRRRQLMPSKSMNPSRYMPY